MARAYVRAGMLAAMVLVFLAPGGCGVRRIDWRNTGAPAGTGFLHKTIEYDGQPRKYVVFVPHDYPRGKERTVVLFLHGLFEGGHDGVKHVNVGLGPAINGRADRFPFIVIFPQSGGYWTGDWEQGLALAALAKTRREYPKADPKRVILGGLSNGGDGVWSLGAKYPDRFAALVPFCGNPREQNPKGLLALPIWAFHNLGDPFKSAKRAREMVVRLEEAGAKVRYTQYDAMGHDCWTRAFEESDVLTWMMEQKKPAGVTPVLAATE